MILIIAVFSSHVAVWMQLIMNYFTGWCRKVDHFISLPTMCILHILEISVTCLQSTVRLYVWRWITSPSQVRINIDTTRAVNTTTHSRWPCFSSGRCTGLECIAFVGQNIVNVLGVSLPAENTAIQSILWRPDMIAISVCCTALTANFDITFCTVPLQHFLQ